MQKSQSALIGKIKPNDRILFITVGKTPKLKSGKQNGSNIELDI